MALFTMTVQVDLPDTTTQADAESYVAFAVAQYFATKALPGNASVTLLNAEQGKTVLDSGKLTKAKAMA